MNAEEQKKAAARAAIEYVSEEMIIGVGTGSTANYFIDALGEIKDRVKAAVASSKASEERLKAVGIPCVELNTVVKLALYVDGADQINGVLQLIKGGGGALTREKIVAQASKQFICIADASKKSGVFGNFPVAVEVIPMARSMVAREIVRLGGAPVYREGFVTDNGNIILDIHNMQIQKPIELEQALNNFPGVVANGLFAMRPANIVLLGTKTGVETLTH